MRVLARSIWARRTAARAFSTAAARLSRPTTAEVTPVWAMPSAARAWATWAWALRRAASAMSTLAWATQPPAFRVRARLASAWARVSVASAAAMEARCWATDPRADAWVWVELDRAASAACRLASACSSR